MESLLTWPMLCVILSGVVLAVLGLSYQMAAATGCRPPAFAAIFLLVATLVAGGRACFESTAWADGRLWGLGLGMGTALYGALAVFVQVNRRGPASVAWTIINLSILFPIFLAPFLWKEPLLAVDGVLLALFILLLLVLRRGLQPAAGEAARTAWSFWPLLTVAFLLNGSFQLGSKLKEVWFPAGNAAGLATIYFGSGLLLAMLTLAWQTRSLRCTPAEWGVGVLAGSCAGLGNLLLLHGMSLPTIVVFPLSQGLALIGGVVLIALVYYEGISRVKLLGLLLSVAVLLLAVLRDPLTKRLHPPVNEAGPKTSSAPGVIRDAARDEALLLTQPQR